METRLAGSKAELVVRNQNKRVETLLRILENIGKGCIEHGKGCMCMSWDDTGGEILALVEWYKTGTTDKPVIEGYTYDDNGVVVHDWEEEEEEA